jgi:flagellar protein FlaG
MSNDISTSAAGMPAAPSAASQPARAADVATKAQQVLDTPKPVAEPKPDPQAARRALEEATEHMNQQMRRNSRDLCFSVDDVANTVVVTVKNRESGEVVRQIPNEVALRIAHNLEDMKGWLQDGKS